MKARGVLTAICILLGGIAAMWAMSSAAEGSLLSHPALTTPLTSPLALTTPVQDTQDYFYYAYLPIVRYTQSKHDSIFAAEVDGGWTNQHGANLITQSLLTKARLAAISWSDIETVTGVYSWSTYFDGVIANMTKSGIAVDLIVRTVPWWARVLEHRYITDTQVCGPMASEYYTTFAAFLGNVIDHYSVPTYTIQYFELGNEPNYNDTSSNGYEGCWNTGRDYATFLKVVYPLTKAAHPDSIIVNGGFGQPPDSDWVRDFIANGGAGATDIFMFHAYETCIHSGSI